MLLFHDLCSEHFFVRPSDPHFDKADDVVNKVVKEFGPLNDVLIEFLRGDSNEHNLKLLVINALAEYVAMVLPSFNMVANLVHVVARRDFLKFPHPAIWMRRSQPSNSMNNLRHNSKPLHFVLFKKPVSSLIKRVPDPFADKNQQVHREVPASHIGAE